MRRDRLLALLGYAPREYDPASLSIPEPPEVPAPTKGRSGGGIRALGLKRPKPSARPSAPSPEPRATKRSSGGGGGKGPNPDTLQARMDAQSGGYGGNKGGGSGGNEGGGSNAGPSEKKESKPGDLMQSLMDSATSLTYETKDNRGVLTGEKKTVDYGDPYKEDRENAAKLHYYEGVVENKKKYPLPGESNSQRGKSDPQREVLNQLIREELLGSR